MDVSEVNNRSKRVGSRLSLASSLVVGLSALIYLISVGGKEQLFAQSYLFGWSLFFAATVGCLVVLILHSLMSSNWGRPFQGFLELATGARIWAYTVIGFIPVVLLMDRIYYKWMFPGDDQVILHKAPFLNTSGWLFRSAIYFGVLFIVGYLLHTKYADRPRLFSNKRSVAAGGAVVSVIAVSFLSVDWYMSIEPHWFSTIYGVWLLSGYILTGLSLMAVALYLCLDRSSIHHVNKTTIPKDIGNLLLAFTLFWSYISISQYLIIWSGNLPEFNTFYIVRQREGWEYFGLSLIIGHFLVPFMLLLSPTVKRSIGHVAKVAIWLLLMRFIDMIWNIVPLYGYGYIQDLRFWIAHISSSILFVALWVGIVAYAVKRRGIMNTTAFGGV